MKKVNIFVNITKNIKLIFTQFTDCCLSISELIWRHSFLIIYFVFLNKQINSLANQNLKSMLFFWNNIIWEFKE